jgi:translation elongation factor EF-Ts
MIQRDGRKVHFTMDGEAFRVDTPADRRRWLVKAAGLALHHIEKSKELEEMMIQERMESLPKDLPIGYFTKGSVNHPRFTVRLLAEMCGVSVRTFYRWFPNWRKTIRSVWGELELGDSR